MIESQQSSPLDLHTSFSCTQDTIDYVGMEIGGHKKTLQRVVSSRHTDVLWMGNEVLDLGREVNYLRWLLYSSEHTVQYLKMRLKY